MADYTTNTGVMKREIFKFTEKISVQSQKLWDEGCCCGRDTKIKDVAQCHKAVKASATPRLRRP